MNFYSFYHRAIGTVQIAYANFVVMEVTLLKMMM